MSSLKVALLQILPTGTVGGNIEKGIEYCKKAKSYGADIALFPEMWSSGYSIPQVRDELLSKAVPADGEFVSVFEALSKQLDMAIGITLLERYCDTARNTVILIDRHGKKKFTYAKVHTCDFGDECVLASGEDFYVTELDTADGIVKVGAMICYDREFPESARILMLKGAEIILVPNACPMEINRISQLRGRAYENMVGIATCNYPYPHPDCNGHSTAFDGIAYRVDGSGSRDTLVIEAGEREGIFIADFDMDAIREYRESEVHGNAYRRPERYGLLIDTKKEPPFIR